ncbi:hypothetical protein NUBL9656_51320 [Klebsiella pneumoniae]|nr:hypothetical protein NUBL9656_51320 [Klebsiella pneumoniae]SXA38935.1 Uncharacterised protein [Klebsiella pneumoniae]SXB80652.1 Uncharacterised protein [Klebsiella pneumoniae]SXB95756.1 Uncharacterised protein [Klebsiella pneumoniae]
MSSALYITATYKMLCVISIMIGLESVKTVRTRQHYNAKAKTASKKGAQFVKQKKANGISTVSLKDQAVRSHT